MDQDPERPVLRRVIEHLSPGGFIGLFDDLRYTYRLLRDGNGSSAAHFLYLSIIQFLKAEPVLIGVLTYFAITQDPESLLALFIRQFVVSPASAEERVDEATVDGIELGVEIAADDVEGILEVRPVDPA